MNKWVKKSINLAKSPGYLDNLSEIYSVELEMTRGIPDETIIKRIKKAHRSKDELQLLEVLFELPRFSIEDPYISSLRKHLFY